MFAGGLNKHCDDSVTYREEDIRALGKQLVEWALNEPRAYRITQFFNMKGIRPDHVDKWRSKWPSLVEDMNWAIAIIGDRRETGALENRLNTAIVMRTQHIYDQVWDTQVNQYHNNLRILEAQSNPELHIHFDDIPKSDMVPKRITKD